MTNYSKHTLHLSTSSNQTIEIRPHSKLSNNVADTCMNWDYKIGLQNQFHLARENKMCSSDATLVNTMRFIY